MRHVACALRKIWAGTRLARGQSIDTILPTPGLETGSRAPIQIILNHTAIRVCAIQLIAPFMAHAAENAVEFVGENLVSGEFSSVYNSTLEV